MTNFIKKQNTDEIFMEGCAYTPEKRKEFPKWVKNPGYLPTLKELKDLKEDRLWDDFVHHNFNGSEFQILTKEFVDSLAYAILKEIERLPKDAVNILEVGAGNGRLAHFLEEALENKNKNKNISLKAADDFSWDNQMGGSMGSPIWIRKIFPVDALPVAEALKNNPDIVIVSWMPRDEDWTKLFRENPSVQSFIMIGREEDCGTEASWLSDDVFQRSDIVAGGNVCWSDFIPGEGGSKVSVFSRQK